MNIRTINNHSAFNVAMQRNGLVTRRNNKEATFKYRLMMDVAKKIRILWTANSDRFLCKYGNTTINGRHYFPDKVEYKLKDLRELIGQEPQSLEVLEQELDAKGYEALEKYLITNLRMKI